MDGNQQEEQLPNSELSVPVVFVAGGLLWGNKIDGVPQIAIVYRRYHGGEWALPKGKGEPNETWQETAIREVKEETGYDSRVLNFAGTTHYTRGGRIKVALFWNMVAKGESDFKPSKEVEKMEWLSVPEALQKLADPGEKELLSKAFRVHPTKNI